jgi:hypothetical protein
MQESVIQASPSHGLHPYLEALRVSGVPAEFILPQAEEMGADPDELLRIAKLLLGSDLASELLSLWVLIGVTRNWQPYLAKAIQLGPSFLLPLLHPPMRPSDPAIDSLGKERRKRLAPVILTRLDYPKILLGSHPLPVNPPDVLPWLEGGGSLWASTLEMQDFASLSLEWISIMANVLILRDAVGPDTLGRECLGYVYTRQPHPVARLIRVSGLRRLQGTGSLHSLTAVSCPDLADIGPAPRILVIKDCPSISNLVCRSQEGLLHLQGCAGLRSIDVQDLYNRDAAPKGTLACQTIVIDDCPNLRILPQQIKTGGDMTLRRMRTFTGWPHLFQVGGDLKIKDCPDFEELPPLAVSGSLRVVGGSGLRRLAPGTVIGRHLDLRACKHLEGIPRGVEVGGCVNLPPHLHRDKSGEGAP